MKHVQKYLFLIFLCLPLSCLGNLDNLAWALNSIKSPVKVPPKLPPRPPKKTVIQKFETSSDKDVQNFSERLKKHPKLIALLDKNNELLRLFLGEKKLPLVGGKEKPFDLDELGNDEILVLENATNDQIKDFVQRTKTVPGAKFLYENWPFQQDVDIDSDYED